MYSMNLTKFEINDLITIFSGVSIGEKIEEQKLKNSIMQHHFNSKVMIHLPNTTTLPDQIQYMLTEDKSFYCVRNLPVQNLCDEDFIKAFVKSGRVYAYTVNTKLDEDNCAALIPAGDLFLLLNSFTYNELGLCGKLSSHILRFPKHKYLVEINTSEDCFILGKKIYERTHQALDSSSLSFDFYITWEPYDKSICPSSIAKYFHDKGFEVEEIEPAYKQTWKSDLKIPNLHNHLEYDRFDHENLLEWLGMCALDIDSEILNENAPEETSILSPLIVPEWEGFYTPATIEEFIQKLRDWLLTQDEKNVPWVCLTVYGPPDCLISWAKTENSFKINGENFYVLVILRNKILYYTIEENKKPQRMYVKSSNKKR